MPAVNTTYNNAKLTTAIGGLWEHGSNGWSEKETWQTNVEEWRVQGGNSDEEYCITFTSSVN